MTKFWDPDTELLAKLKNAAFRTGKKAQEKNAMFLLRQFYNKHDLEHMLFAGKTMEIMIAFVLGMIQKFMGKSSFEVEMTAEDDDAQIDFRINGKPIQQKFCWEPDDDEMIDEQNRLWWRGILLVIIERYKEGGDYDIIDTLTEIMEFADVPKESIEKELDEDPALDIAEEIWKWYCDRMKLKKLPQLRSLYR